MLAVVGVGIVGIVDVVVTVERHRPVWLCNGSGPVPTSSRLRHHQPALLRPFSHHIGNQQHSCTRVNPGTVVVELWHCIAVGGDQR